MAATTLFVCVALLVLATALAGGRGQPKSVNSQGYDDPLDGTYSAAANEASAVGDHSDTQAPPVAASGVDASAAAAPVAAGGGDDASAAAAPVAAGGGDVAAPAVSNGGKMARRRSGGNRVVSREEVKTVKAKETAQSSGEAGTGQVSIAIGVVLALLGGIGGTVGMYVYKTGSAAKQNAAQQNGMSNIQMRTAQTIGKNGGDRQLSANIDAYGAKTWSNEV